MNSTVKSIDNYINELLINLDEIHRRYFTVMSDVNHVLFANVKSNLSEYCHCRYISSRVTLLNILTNLHDNIGDIESAFRVTNIMSQNEEDTIENIRVCENAAYMMITLNK